MIGDLLIVFAELGIALTGFAGVVIALGWQTREVARLRLGGLFFITVGVVVGAISPLVLQTYGIPDEAMWRWTSAAVLAGYVVYNATLLRRTWATGGKALIVLNRSVSAAIFVTSMLVSLGLLGNAAGWPYAPHAGAYLIGLAWPIVLALLLFVDLALNDPDEAAGTD